MLESFKKSRRPGAVWGALGVLMVTWMLTLVQPQPEAETNGGRAAAGKPDDTGNHRCGALECGACGLVGRMESHRVVELERVPEWTDLEVGEWTEAGFALGGMSRMKVVGQARREDGAGLTDLQLPSGDKLLVVSIGDGWSGRMLPLAGGAGWRLSGEGTRVEIGEFVRAAMICTFADEDGKEVMGLPPVEGSLSEESLTLEEAAETTPPFSSLPGATGVIYLDFDGETVINTQWNAQFNNGEPIVAAPSGFTGTQVEAVWKAVSEDFLPFHVNVTTDRAAFDAAPYGSRTSVIFTPSYEWYNKVGGVAYVDVFGDPRFDAPAWVFPINLANSPAHSAEAASHEVGHTLGLLHDGTSTKAYYEGHGSGATKWAPIMGVSYYATVSQWSKGEYPDANNQENDLAIISSLWNGLGYRTDDHADTIAGATPLTELGGGQVEGAGIIERGEDFDMFVFQTSGGEITMAADNFELDPNLDIRLRLLGSAGEELAVADPVSSLDASITTTLAGGTYYLEVSGTGTGDLVTGYSEYGSLGAYTIRGSAPNVILLAAEILSPTVERLVLPEGSGLILDGMVSGGTMRWEAAEVPDGGAVTLSSENEFAVRAWFSGAGLYRLRLLAEAGTEQASDEIEVTVEIAGANPAPAAGTGARATGVDLGRDRNIYHDRLALAPKVAAGSSVEPLIHEWTVLAGSGQLSSTGDPNPELGFPVSDGMTELRLVVDDGMARTFAEVGLTPRFQEEQWIGATTVATALVPDGGGLGLDWADPDFDDSGWVSGELGVGYDVRNPPKNRIFPPLIGLDVGAGMFEQRAGCYVRIPFQVDSPEAVISLVLRMNFDDGFVAYLNGVEVARDNVAEGTPAWDGLAVADRPDEEGLVAVSYVVPQGVLRFGTNVLAIHGMNAAVGGSDDRFLCSPELTAVVAKTPFKTLLSTISDPGLRGSETDADGDGRSNFQEHLMGTDPAAADEGYAMLKVVDIRTAKVTLPQDAPDDVRYRLLHSSDPKTGWQPMAERVGNGPWIGLQPTPLGVVPGGREDWSFTMGESAWGFFRLQVDYTTTGD